MLEAGTTVKGSAKGTQAPRPVLRGVDGSRGGLLSTLQRMGDFLLGEQTPCPGRIAVGAPRQKAGCLPVSGFGEPWVGFQPKWGCVPPQCLPVVPSSMIPPDLLQDGEL